MKKIPTMFERDWRGDRSRVTPTAHPGCEWVANGEGVPTRKLDGTSCRIKDGKLFKRRELRKGEAQPPMFELADFDEATGKTIGWLPCDSSPENHWHLEAFGTARFVDGSYELVGPKIQGNPERYGKHTLVNHRDPALVLAGVPSTRSYNDLRAWLQSQDIEGIVFHHGDGRMAKIKLRDFGLKRNA